MPSIEERFWSKVSKTAKFEYRQRYSVLTTIPSMSNRGSASNSSVRSEAESTMSSRSVIGYANGNPIFAPETRAVMHDPHSGKFVGGGGSGNHGTNPGMAKAALKAAGGYQKKANASTDSARKGAYQASANAYTASHKAHTSGSAADHKAAHEAHGAAEAAHSAIHRGSDHNGAIKGHHGAEASGHALMKGQHS